MEATPPTPSQMLAYLEEFRSTGATSEQLPNDIYRNFFSEILAKKTLAAAASNSLLECFDAVVSNQEVPPPPTDEDVWIFGYGSLVWKADFPYIDRRRGFVWGFKRRFYQHSIDHRGIPERPGRVVTLLPGDPSKDRVYGVAYRIAGRQKGAVLDHLDYREKNGYERCSLHFHEYPKTSAAGVEPIQVIMYVATQANDSYAGDVWQVPCIARQIFSSAGPSGPNREYLFNLATAMEQLFPGAVDEHLVELVASVRRFIDEDEPHLLEGALLQEISAALQEGASSHQDQAERLHQLLERSQQPGGREWLLHGQLKRKNEA
ncbi:putative glutathione-specific gamma-glutamylcyclotransferase 2 [Drosophila bipectinata]|uniref:putative glutathione-specific gamma-glutamylcyclotransferase 2 n=1 Tax=Drosophila bipectinata TaxID=42026 RepID=UPI001C8AEA9D|nr:putative glutathione-specific gamma-glutamylcyclotransferase 2 [Drosophila bipectinata]